MRLYLYGDESFERSRWLMKAMDEINHRHGRDPIRFGLAQPGGGWKT
jgi:hypothetical protein